MARFRVLVGVLVLVFSSVVYARPLTFEEKASDLNQLVSIIKSGYGPLQYKKRVLSIDVDSLRDVYLDKVRATKTNGEFYYLIRQFVAEFKDSHFSASIPTKQVASLPFVTDLVEGKVLIDTIDRKKLSEDKFPFAKGDELVEFDGKPVDEVVTQLMTYMGKGYELTSRRVAAQTVTYRPGSAVPVPSGEVTFKIRRGTSKVIENGKLEWDVKGEALDEKNPAQTIKLGVSADSHSPRNFDLLSIRDMWDNELPRAEKSFKCSGGTRVQIPSDATVLQMEPFVAYYHPTAKGNVGYLRIPHYYWQDEQTGKDLYELRFKQYEYLLSVLEKNTVGLIIDQDHNCGGRVSFLNSMVSLFASVPFQTTRFTLLANKREYLEFKKWADELDKNTIAWHDINKTIELIKNSWLNGDFMTPNASIDGGEFMAPHSVRYTKPIVMLIDEMSGSGGDAFPAAMQGIGRAKLLGTRTMGAGGHVEEQPPLSYSQIQVRMTKSLFFRPDGVAVENNGAVPDYPYATTRDDFIYGYRDYQAFYLGKLLEMLP